MGLSGLGSAQPSRVAFLPPRTGAEGCRPHCKSSKCAPTQAQPDRRHGRRHASAIPPGPAPAHGTQPRSSTSNLNGHRTSTSTTT
eukprot:2932310-Prymnesium_polylepis.1